MEKLIGREFRISAFNSDNITCSRVRLCHTEMVTQLRNQRINGQKKVATKFSAHHCIGQKSLFSISGQHFLTRAMLRRKLSGFLLALKFTLQNLITSPQLCNKCCAAKHFTYRLRIITDKYLNTIRNHPRPAPAYHTRTQSLFMSLGERERRLDSIEARGVVWEGAKEK